MNEKEHERIERSMQLLAKAAPRPIDDLIPYQRNQKDHDERQVKNIATSLRRFGWRQPVVVDERNVIVIGHGRVLAAKQLGLQTVPTVDAADLTEDEIRELRIIDNKTNESPWNSYLDEDLKELSFDGFDFADLDNGEAGGGADISDIKEDEPPQPPEKPVTRPGQLFQLGSHRLLCGDSTNAEDVRTLCAGQPIHLLLTDPPYNVALNKRSKSKNASTIQNDDMKEESFVQFLSSAFKNAEAALAPGGAFYIFYASSHHVSFETAIQAVGDFWIHEQLIWVKDHFVLGMNSDYQWQHEPCFYGWKEGAPHYFTNSRAESTVREVAGAKLGTMKKEELIALCKKLMGMDKPKTIIYAEKPNSADLHPTVKPQSLIAPLIANSTKPSWNVLDLFGGSGSTMIACEQLGRSCYTMELDPHYCDVIIQRWQNFTGQQAVLLNG